jgi:hypothetical protein
LLDGKRGAGLRFRGQERTRGSDPVLSPRLVSWRSGARDEMEPEFARLQRLHGTSVCVRGQGTEKERDGDRELAVPTNCAEAADPTRAASSRPISPGIGRPPTADCEAKLG